MPRAPFQVSAICYKREKGVFLYAIFKTRDSGYWQFIAGGGEGQESPDEAVRREAWEEAGLPLNLNYLKLDTACSVPADCFPEAQKHWPANLYVIPLHYWAVEAGSISVRLSTEHTEYRWVTYGDAAKSLHWQSDVTALKELEKRLRSS